MEYQSVVCQITRKYNLGNYESEEINVMMSARLEADEDPNEAYNELMHRCHAARHETEIELGLRKAPAVVTQSYVAGKPVEKDYSVETNDYLDF